MMDIRDPTRLGPVLKSIKVQIPADLCIRLHAHKVITGTSLAETVETALLQYFERVNAERSALRATAVSL